MTPHDEPTPVGPQPETGKSARRSMEEKFPRSLWVRLVIYVFVGHIFAAFVYLLFALGAQNQ